MIVGLIRRRMEDELHTLLGKPIWRVDRWYLSGPDMDHLVRINFTVQHAEVDPLGRSWDL